jgi:hypothetical protein
MDHKNAHQSEEACLKTTSARNGKKCSRLALGICCILSLSAADRVSSQIDRVDRVPASPRPRVSPSAAEYLWYEAENMRGITETSRHEPLLNPSYLNLPAAQAPGWSISGPGVSAEWTQGGESEWNSVAASADATSGEIWQDLEIPRAGDYKIWVRYADFANQRETFAVRLGQTEVAGHEFGAKDIIDPHDEVSMYWGWAFAWDSTTVKLQKGHARIFIKIEKASDARRQVDCVLVTNDISYVPQGRSKPDFAAMRYLRDWASTRVPLSPLIEAPARMDVPPSWTRPRIAGRNFLMPWNIAKEFWQLYDKPPAERPLYPFHAEPIDEFVKAYSGKRDVPIFSSKIVVPTIYINDLPELLKDGSGFRRYVAETKTPFAILLNYGAANFASEADAQAAWKVLNGELRDQFLGWISGESIGFVWAEAPQYLKISPDMTRTQLLEAHRTFYTDALARKWSAMFKTQTGPMWDKMIPAQSTSSTSFAHALGEWGVRSFGMETAAVQPMTAMRIAFTRGAARQYGGNVFYYHAPNFGDTATTFTKQQNFAGPDNFFHSRYGATMGPSLSWYRKSYYLYYMSGASAIYLEQGFDQFFKPGPGEHPFQLNPLGRITDEFVRFAEQHPDPGAPYTPIAFLLDPAHGWEMTDYPHWPFEVSQINRSDRALRELIGAAYYPGPVREGEPASGERQTFVPGIFGNIFDVLVASETHKDAIDSYRAIVVGGRIDWTSAKAEGGSERGSSPTAGARGTSPTVREGSSQSWPDRLTNYVRNGGTLVINSAQVKGLPADLLGIRMTGVNAEAHNAKCLSPNEPEQDLSGQIFRYDRVEAKGAEVLIAVPTGDPLVTVNKVGRGRVVFVALPDLLGEDERLTPFVAHMLAHLASDATPVKVEGDVEYMINRTARGWVVTLFNDNGVFKPQQGLAQVDRSASVNVTISLRGATISNAVDWTSARTLTVSGQSGVTLRIPPGGIAILELSTANK